MRKTASDMVTAARGLVENLSVDDVAAEAGRGALLVDLREEEERRANGAIPGSLHAPRGMLEFYADPATPYHKDALKPDARIILYCASGGRSALAATTLKEMGFTDVAHLQAGFKSWAEANQPIERL